MEGQCRRPCLWREWIREDEVLRRLMGIRPPIQMMRGNDGRGGRRGIPTGRDDGEVDATMSEEKRGGMIVFSRNV